MYVCPMYMDRKLRATRQLAVNLTTLPALSPLGPTIPGILITALADLLKFKHCTHIHVK